MKTETAASEVELGQLDLRYEGYRMKKITAWLPASVQLFSVQ